mmetsp:Transcript_21530/g.41188  ORF Transcript_21530/g.41188 Transcript_21530/m.41188 type:complete len:93 (+) Transcript_21530:1-279(+)
MTTMTTMTLRPAARVPRREPYPRGFLGMEGKAQRDPAGRSEQDQLSGTGRDIFRSSHLDVSHLTFPRGVFYRRLNIICLVFVMLPCVVRTCD